MKVLIDTSILFPALNVNHPYHPQVLAFVQGLESRGSVVVLNTHLLAELFNNLTRQPRLPISVTQASDVLHTLSDRYERVDLDTDDYLAAIKRCARLNLRGGVIYDALHFQAAIKAKVDILYTSNLRDFNRLLTDEITFKVEGPQLDDGSKN